MNIAVASECKQRSLVKDIVGDNIVAEVGAFTFSPKDGGEEIREVPFVYVPNLVRKVADVIEEHSK